MSGASSTPSSPDKLGERGVQGASAQSPTGQPRSYVSNGGISPVAYLSWACFGLSGMAALEATVKAVRRGT